MRRIAFFPRGWMILEAMTILVATCVLISTNVPAWADTPWQRAGLKGIKEVEVVVEDMSPEAEKDGLTRDQLQTDVELRLRKAGIRVTSGAVAFLYVIAHPMKHPRGFYAYSIHVMVEEMVSLERDPSISLVGTTWRSTGGVGIVGVKVLKSLRDRVSDQVDEFINAYFDQNPKR